jgi:hypothetical protein
MTLSGKFHIAMKLSFQELSEHQVFQTWLHQYGYSVIKNGCQTSDMVRIGFLMRVRGFTYRDDLQDYIIGSEEWKTNQFHFRMHFNTFVASSKGKLAHMLMIDVDHPSIKVGINFYQYWFQGEEPYSPNGIACLFLPLYKKSYTDEERMKIVMDHEHHLGNDSVVTLQGLKPLKTIIELNNGTHTTIRNLLLSIPATGTQMNKLFVQVERQANNNWLLCCFYTQDAAKVTICLGQPEDCLKKNIRVTSFPKCSMVR